jgi:hypothetical protein
VSEEPKVGTLFNVHEPLPIDLSIKLRNGPWKPTLASGIRGPSKPVRATHNIRTELRWQCWLYTLSVYDIFWLRDNLTFCRREILIVIIAPIRTSDAIARAALDTEQVLVVSVASALQLFDGGGLYLWHVKTVDTTDMTILTRDLLIVEFPRMVLICTIALASSVVANWKHG